jgi:hypothetical protein
LAPTALAVLALAGCGSGATKTVSVSGGAGAASTAPGAAGAESIPPTATKTSTSPSTGGSAAASPTRTAPAPAFAQRSGGAGGAEGVEGVDQAVAVLKAHGYTPADTSQYHSAQTLRVLVGTRTGSGDGYAQQAFFFLDGRYLGTDASAPSAGIDVVAQSDTEVTLGYRLYRPGDPLCCARGGQADVRFQLNDGRLSALDPIPPVESSTGASRR